MQDMQELMGELGNKVSSGELFKVNFMTVPIDYEMNQLKSINSEEVMHLALLNQKMKTKKRRIKSLLKELVFMNKD